jgi:hypothetical protein
MWANNYTSTVNTARIVTAEPDDKYIWKLGATEKHCETCGALAGVVARAKDWEELFAQGIEPQGDKLMCGGWQCDCEVIITDEPLTKGGIPAVQTKALKHLAGTENDHDQSTHAGGGGVTVEYVSSQEVTIGGDLATAYYDKSTGTILIDKNFAETASPKQIAGVIAHETFHAREDSYDKQKLHQLLKEPTDEYLAVAGQDMDYDERARYEDDYRVLIWELGGVSEYSNRYFTNRVLGFDRAVSETLAEVARLQKEGEYVPPMWEKIYNELIK